MANEQTFRYFARQQRCTDYPYDGEVVWGIRDTRGTFYPCRDEQSAVAQAMIRNAQSEQIGGLKLAKVQICAGAGVALVLPEGATKLEDALYKVRYILTKRAATECGLTNDERNEERALTMAREWAEYRGYEVEEIPYAPW